MAEMGSAKLLPALPAAVKIQVNGKIQGKSRENMTAVRPHASHPSDKMKTEQLP